MKAEEAYALSRKYTEDTIEGAGAVAGKPCQIQSITDITGGHRVTFLWLDNEGATHTSAMDVMDGAKGDKGDSGDAGLGIKSVAVNAEDHLIITYDDDTTQDAGQIQVMAAVDSVNGKTGDVVLGASDVGALPDDTDIPSKTSDLTNDSIVDSASYDSTNHTILFKNGTTTLFSLDATAFVKDGMVDDVEISGGNLVITFNTDAGKQAISIPLTDIFDPANYYDKDDVDGLLGDKADKVESATNGDFAGLDANGNLTDSGKSASDFGTADEISDIVNVYGAKNLLSYPYYETTKTSNGITFTDLGNGTIRANGTATADVFFTLHSRFQNDVNNLILKNGKYVLTGCPSGGSLTTYGIKIGRTYNNAYNEYGADMGDGVSITLNGDDYSADEVEIQIQIIIRNGATVSNLTFKPMLRLASIEDDTYVPYVPTNAKLDEVKVSYTDASESVQKNLIENKATTTTSHGLTFTSNSDGSVTVNGTSNAITWFYLNGSTDWTETIKAGRYILSSGVTMPTGTRLEVNASGDTPTSRILPTYSSDEFSISQDITCRVGIRISADITLSNLRIYPMLRKATIKDDTWQPYIPNNTELTTWKANGILGAKNLIREPYLAGKTYTQNGITYTWLDDGTVKANGTATGNSRYYFQGINQGYTLPRGRYILTDGLTNSGLSTFAIDVALYQGTTYKNIHYNTSNGEVKFSLDGTSYDNLAVYIMIPTGVTVNNLIFKPMLRLAEDTDDTYQPYAMTNRELTEEVNALPREIFVTTDTRTTTTNDANTLPCGFTRMSDANSNLPTDGTGGNVWYDILTVRQSNDSSRETWGYGFQLAVQTTTNANMGDMYVRAVNGGATPTWSEWKKLN